MSSTYYNLTITERTKFGSKEAKNNRKAGLVLLFYITQVKKCSYINR